MVEAVNWRDLPAFIPPPLEDLLPPDEGSTSKKLVSVLAPVRSTQRKPISIEDARFIIEQRIFEYLEIPEPDYALLINAPAGVGKTTIGIGQSENRAIMGRKVIYLGPRHDHYDDVLRASQKMNPGNQPLWRHWWPRQYENIAKNRPETCIHTERQNQWMSKGWDAAKFCLGVCKPHYMNNECPFHAQKRQLSNSGYIVYGQHQHLFTGHPVESEIMFVDESPLQALQRVWKVPWKEILPHRGRILPDYLPIKPILMRLRDLAGDASLAISGRPLMDLLGGGDVVARAISASAKGMPIRATFQPLIRDVEDADNAFYAHMWDLCEILHREALAHAAGKDYPHRVEIRDRCLYIRMRRFVHETTPKHLICLDATGRGDLYEKILTPRRVEVVSPDIVMKGEITQVWTSGWGKGQLVTEDDRIDPNRATKLQILVNAIAAKYPTVGLITHQLLEILAPANCAEVGHFSAERGTNRFEEEPAMIIAGTPQPSLKAIEELAMSLYPDRMEPFRDAEGKFPWTKKKVSYDFIHEDGHGRAIDTAGFWDDPDLQMLVWQLREAELIQAIHRARPLLRPDARIYDLSNIPLEGMPIAHLLSTPELLKAPLRMDPYLWGRAEVFAASRHDEDGASLTIRELVIVLKIERRAASRVLHGLAVSGHWRWPTKEERAKVDRKEGQQELVIVPC